MFKTNAPSQCLRQGKGVFLPFVLYREAYRCNIARASLSNVRLGGVLDGNEPPSGFFWSEKRACALGVKEPAFPSRSEANTKQNFSGKKSVCICE